MDNKYPTYNLGSVNFKMITVSLLLLILSYILMHLGARYDLEFISITISPIMQLMGYSVLIFAIFKS